MRKAWLLLLAFSLLAQPVLPSGSLRYRVWLRLKLERLVVLEVPTPGQCTMPLPGGQTSLQVQTWTAERGLGLRIRLLEGSGQAVSAPGLVLDEQVRLPLSCELSGGRQLELLACEPVGRGAAPSGPAPMAFRPEPAPVSPPACSHCNGTAVCQACLGRALTCQVCWGSNKCPRCGGSHDCPACGGAGCSICGGKGKCLSCKDGECYACRGKKPVCTMCGGSGRCYYCSR